MGDENFRGICVGKSCGWNSFSSRLSCTSGDGSCLDAELVIADESSFHTAELVKATHEIREILTKIKHRHEHKLSFLNTPFGLMLAWVRHDIETPDDAITIESSSAEIAEALGVKRRKHESAAKD